MGAAQAVLRALKARPLLLGALGVAVCAVAIGASLATRGGGASSARLQASPYFRVLKPEDLPAQIEGLGAEGRVWAVRAPATLKELSGALAGAQQFIRDSQRIIADAFPERPVAPRLRVLSPLLAQDGAEGPALFASLEGEALDGAGRPLRWHLPENVLHSYSLPRPAPFQMPAPSPVNPQLAAALAKLAPSRSAGAYRSMVESHARPYGLNVDLVMAIIHSESNFMPTLVSRQNAMGLMQLLPSTASGEVHQFLYGRRGSVNFEQLAVPEINIRYGTAYLHILHDRYFANVRDRQVREACVIAAYNMGPNGFLRLYGATPEQAVAAINAMGSDEFHEDLPRRLPMRETRFYVEKVKRMKRHYAGMR